MQFYILLSIIYDLGDLEIIAIFFIVELVVNITRRSGLTCIAWRHNREMGLLRKTEKESEDPRLVMNVTVLN